MSLTGYPGTDETALKRSGVKIVLAIAFAVALLAAGAIWIASMVPSLMTPTISQEQLEEAAKRITTAQQDGLLVRYDCLENRAHVEPMHWRALSLDLKQSLATALATTCQAEHRGYRMTIIDVRTGRDLANFSSGTFRVY